MIDENSNVLKTVQVYEYSIERLYGWVHCLPGPGAIIRKSAIVSGYQLRSPDLRYVSDLESWFRLGLIGEFARIPATLATWRLHGGSTSIADKCLARAEETIQIVRSFYDRHDLPEEICVLKRMAVSRANYLASVFVRRSNPIRSLLFLLKAVCLMPVQPADMPLDIRRAQLRKILRSALPNRFD